MSKKKSKKFSVALKTKIVLDFLKRQFGMALLHEFPLVFNKAAQD